jgi:hypothetical protein
MRAVLPLGTRAICARHRSAPILATSIHFAAVDDLFEATDDRRWE